MATYISIALIFAAAVAGTLWRTRRQRLQAEAERRALEDFDTKDQH